MTVRTLIGDVRDRLKELPDESVHCVVTSPPYWGLRDYSVHGQLGLEATYQEHVATMGDVFDEVRRVLRKDGTLWLNYGDSYASTISGHKTGEDGRIRPGHNGATTQFDDRTFTQKPFSTIQGILKPKDLCGIPWRVAFALQERGWYLRQDIIWAKPNPMPESVTDRCTKAHEYVFLLAKSPRYYFDAEAIREPVTGNAHSRGNGINPKAIEGLIGRERQNTSFSAAINGLGSSRSGNKERKSALLRGCPADGVDGSIPWEGTERNKRSVWTIATAPYSEAHFATFPPELAKLCIKAGTSQKGCCAACGAPWMRDVEIDDPNGRLGKACHDHVDDLGRGHRGVPDAKGAPSKRTIGWSPSCQCNAATQPCTVLDPFGGAGTTGVVADRLQRHAILIELNPTYAELARKRLAGDRGGLLDLMEAGE